MGIPMHRGTLRSGTGVWRAVVTRASPVWVQVPTRNGGHDFGPCDVVEGLWSPRLTGNTGTTPAHTHDVGADLAAGDRVLVAFLTDDPTGNPVVVGRLA